MKNLKKCREEKCLTQQQMADLLGIQRPTYTRYESGERQPDFQTVLKISQVLGVTTDYLLGNSDTPLSLDQQLEGIDFALYGEVHDLTDEEKQDILNFVKYTKSKRRDTNEN